MPHVMSEIEETISMDLRLGDIEIGADQRNQDRVEDIVDEFVK